MMFQGTQRPPADAVYHDVSEKQTSPAPTTTAFAQRSGNRTSGLSSVYVYVELRTLRRLLGNVSRDVQLDAPPNAVGGGTACRVRGDRALSLFPHACRDGQRVTDADTGDPENLVDGFDIALDGGSDLVGWCRNVAHLQCAGKGAKQSSTDGGHHMVQGGRHLLFRLDTVESLDSTVYAESNRCIEAFEKRLARWPLDPFNSQTTGVNDFSHCGLLLLLLDATLANHGAVKKNTVDRIRFDAGGRGRMGLQWR